MLIGGIEAPLASEPPRISESSGQQIIATCTSGASNMTKALRQGKRREGIDIVNCRATNLLRGLEGPEARRARDSGNSEHRGERRRPPISQLSVGSPVKSGS